MSDEPIFTSVGQALHVSWLMEILPVTQKVSTQVLIETIREQLGKVEARVASTINIGGLSPLEFRGQCAMVRGVCQHHLSKPEFEAVRLRYGWQRSQAEGVQGMSEYLGPLMRLEHALAERALLWSMFHRGNRSGLSLRDIERETGIGRDRLHRASATVKQSMEALERRAYARLQVIFESTGLVPNDRPLQPA
jgi:hypothetical protein